MALEKAKIVKGYSAEYWRIIQINSNFDRPDAVTTFALYKDQATRVADYTAVVDSYQIDLSSDLLNLTGDNDTVKNINLARAYAAFKSRAQDEADKPVGQRDESLAWFSDAVDV